MSSAELRSDILKAIEILNKNMIPRYKCAVCGHNAFSAADKAATILLTSEKGSIQIGEHIPAFAVVCKNCGYIHLFALNQVLNQTKEGGTRND